MIIKHFFTLSASLILTTACSSYDNPCEQILDVKQQEQQCIALKKTMNDSQHPQQALTAKKRYETACQNLRYYRDQFETICKGDERAIAEVKRK